MTRPKPPSFTSWLRQTGQMTVEEMVQLNNEWGRVKPGSADHKVYTTAPITWNQFVASKYPRKVLAYQAYLRLIGGAVTPLKKEDKM